MFGIAPNPSSHNFTIQSLPSNSNASIRVTDISGKTIDTFTGVENNFTFGESYSSGVYFVTLTSNFDEQIIKIIKQ